MKLCEIAAAAAEVRIYIAEQITGVLTVPNFEHFLQGNVRGPAGVPTSSTSASSRSAGWTVADMAFAIQWHCQQGTRTADNRDHVGIGIRGDPILAIVLYGSKAGSASGLFAREIARCVVDWFVTTVVEITAETVTDPCGPCRGLRERLGKLCPGVRGARAACYRAARRRLPAWPSRWQWTDIMALAASYARVDRPQRGSAGKCLLRKAFIIECCLDRAGCQIVWAVHADLDPAPQLQEPPQNLIGAHAVTSAGENL